jgi:hypothetical protein
MPYAFVDNVAGYPTVEDVVAAPTNLKDLPILPGFLAQVFDPVYGPGEAVFARASAGIRLGGLCALTPTWDATNLTMQQNMAEVANTANLGRAVYVYLGRTALTTGQYGWFLATGVAPVNGTATVSSGTTVGITAAGQIGANSAGKQVVNAVSAVPATNTVAKTGAGAIGDNQIFFPSGTAGFFVGGYLSGTGVGTAAIVQQVLPDRLIVTVVNSAAIAGTVTQTANNAVIFYNFVAINRPFAQGAIT